MYNYGYLIIKCDKDFNDSDHVLCSFKTKELLTEEEKEEEMLNVLKDYPSLKRENLTLIKY